MITTAQKMNAIVWKKKMPMTLKDNNNVIEYIEWPEDVEKPTNEEIDSWTSEFLSSREYLVSQFNPKLAIGREAQVFNVEELMRFMPFSYTINEMITFKNFWGGDINGVPYVGLKQVGLGLVQTGQITQSDYDKLNGILLEQGIDLNSI